MVICSVRRFSSSAIIILVNKMSFDITGIGTVANAIGGILDKIIPDKTAAAAAKAQLLAQQDSEEFQLLLGQLKINQTEASSTNWFVAGWRPFVGWVCGTALVYQFILYPILGSSLPFKALDVQTLVSLLFALLGLGTMRTVEKSNGTENNRS